MTVETLDVSGNGATTEWAIGAGSDIVDALSGSDATYLDAPVLIKTETLDMDGEGATTDWDHDNGTSTATDITDAVTGADDTSWAYGFGSESQNWTVTNHSTFDPTGSGHVFRSYQCTCRQKSAGASGSRTGSAIWRITGVGGGTAATLILTDAITDITTTTMGKPGGGDWTEADMNSAELRLKMNSSNEFKCFRLQALLEYLDPADHYLAMDNSAMGASDSVNSFTYRVRGRYYPGEAGNSQIKVIARLSGNTTESGVITLDGTFQTYTGTLARPGGGAWTKTDIDAVELELSSENEYRARVSLLNFDNDYTGVGGPGPWILSGTVPSGAEAFRVEGLTNSTAYDIQVKAVDTSGNVSTGVTTTNLTPTAGDFRPPPLRRPLRPPQAYPRRVYR